MIVSTLINSDTRVEDPKRARVLEGAMEVFLAYGFSRTTMDDIARAVDISRPALYLLFRNKADIFRAVEQDLLAKSRANACAALRGEGSFQKRLLTALDQALFQLLRKVHESPHGEELVDFNNQIAADLVTEWRSFMVERFARSIGEEASRRGVSLEDRGHSAQSLAEMLFDMLAGMKARGKRGFQAEPQCRQFIKLIELALDKK